MVIMLQQNRVAFEELDRLFNDPMPLPHRREPIVRVGFTFDNDVIEGHSQPWWDSCETPILPIPLYTPSNQTNRDFQKQSRRTQHAKQRTNCQRRQLCGTTMKANKRG